jgi:hypothetical protein
MYNALAKLAHVAQDVARMEMAGIRVVQNV